MKFVIAYAYIDMAASMHGIHEEMFTSASHVLPAPAYVHDQYPLPPGRKKKREFTDINMYKRICA